MCGGRDVKENVHVESERWIERMTGEGRGVLSRQKKVANATMQITY